MFHKVRILDQKGKLIKVITSEALSKRHWGLFEDQLKPSFAKTNNFTNSPKGKKLRSDFSVYPESYGLESC
mgnify:CR=1 FL=1